MASECDGHQYVGIDLHRRQSLQIEKAGIRPDVVLEATYGWYWAPTPAGRRGRGPHGPPLAVKGMPSCQPALKTHRPRATHPLPGTVNRQRRQLS
jgi:hypothetical protein